MWWRRGMKRGTEQREEERMWHHCRPNDPPSPSPNPPAQLWPVICERGLNGETAGTLRRGTAAPCSQSGAPGAIHHTPHPGLLWPETEGGWERRGETHPLSPAFAPRAVNVFCPNNPHFPPSPTAIQVRASLISLVLSVSRKHHTVRAWLAGLSSRRETPGPLRRRQVHWLP